MTCTGLDLTLNDVLTDPMIAAAMRADRVDPQGFERLLRTTAQTLGTRRNARFSAVAGLAGQVCRGMTRPITGL